MLARDKLLSVVTPKRGDYFEPPSVFRPAAGRGVVKRLDEDIAAVDLDPLGRGFVAARAGEDTGRAGEDPHSN